MRTNLRLALLALPLALLLAACTVTFQPDDGSTPVRPTPPGATVRPPVVERPQPPVAPAGLPGQGAVLQFEVTPNDPSPGRTMIFRTRFARAGFLTVSALAPNGRVEVLLHNYPVAPGFQLVPPTSAPPSDRVRASAPVGTWVVRAQFTETRTPARYQNVQGYDAWTAAVVADLRGVAGASVYETSYRVSTP